MVVGGGDGPRKVLLELGDNLVSFCAAGHCPEEKEKLMRQDRNGKLQK